MMENDKVVRGYRTGFNKRQNVNYDVWIILGVPIQVLMTYLIYFEISRVTTEPIILMTEEPGSTKAHTQEKSRVTVFLKAN